MDLSKALYNQHNNPYNSVSYSLFLEFECYFDFKFLLALQFEPFFSLFF